MVNYLICKNMIVFKIFQVLYKLIPQYKNYKIPQYKNYNSVTEVVPGCEESSIDDKVPDEVN